MLEDIRNHSPIPREDEIQWMRARPLRALGRVLVLTMLAASAATAVVEVRHSQPMATIAQNGARTTP